MKILIADKFEAAGIEQLKQAGCTITQDADLTGESLAEALASNGVEGLIVRSTKVTAEMLTGARALKLIIRAGSGYNTIDIDKAREQGIAVANCPGMNSIAVAELAMGLILALDRRIVDNVIEMRKGIWNKKEFSKARGLQGRTLGIVGLGQIGVLIARRAAAFGMRLIYSDIVANDAAEQELALRRVEFTDLLKTADFVTLHVPLSDQTRHLINQERLALMKPTACLVNCSRGEVVDAEALVSALDSGKLAGAGLDVYENEPGAADREFTDPVARCTRVYGTHHIGASTEQAQMAVAEETVRIVRHLMDTGEVLHRVN